MKIKPHSLGIILLPILVVAFSSLACSTSNIFATATPAPTYTLYPTYTPYPTATATLPYNQTFSENFDGSPSCFQTFSDSNAIFQQTNGVFSFELLNPNQSYWSICQNQGFNDFVFEVEVTIPESATNEYQYGVVFRNSGTQYYLFTIDTNKGGSAYCIDYSDGTTYYPLTGSSITSGNCWVVMPANIYDPQRNTLRVSAIGDTIQVYLNNATLGLVHDNRLVAGRIGFIVTTFDQQSVDVLFDNVRVSEP
jgi:hypothetical protein